MAYPKKDIDFSSFDNAVKETPASSLDFSSFDNVVKKKENIQYPSTSSQKGTLSSSIVPSESLKNRKPTINDLTPLEKKYASGMGLFVAPPDEQEKMVATIISQRATPKPIKKVVKAPTDLITKRMVQEPVKSDMTYMQKPISEADIQEKERLHKQHLENLDKAIENTTDAYFKNKGLTVQKNSPLWNERSIS